ncbi:hypothetical protein NDU88_006566 [Pleurodeles waltl]|uniref:Uncharacterized protein n=1 Tax=Pleurodeles waltl TaxID=8319 RepID=A0AAV7QNY3_PLEWA|nr:hypothetical protein NDU88_006566 [Pleurodeles waltl]
MALSAAHGPHSACKRRSPESGCAAEPPEVTERPKPSSLKPATLHVLSSAAGKGLSLQPEFCTRTLTPSLFGFSRGLPKTTRECGCKGRWHVSAPTSAKYYLITGIVHLTEADITRTGECAKLF